MNKQPELEISQFGTKNWRLNGKLHREDGPAVEWKNGDKEWCLKGERHRENGPAFERVNGYKEWWLNGEYHREDGPAIIYPNGSKEWWLNNILYSKEEWFKRLTPEQQYNYLWSLDE
jgi:hypothetical protein